MANATIYVATTGSDSTGDGSAGNPYATPGKAGGAITGSGNTIWIKAGTYTCTSATANVAGGQLAPPAGASGAPNVIAGYNSTIGDLDAVNDFTNFPVYRGAAAGPSRMIYANATAFVWVKNLIIDGASQASYGFDLEGSYCQAVNCKAINLTARGFYIGGAGSQVLHCLASGGSYGYYCDSFSCQFTACTATGATTAGFYGLSYKVSYLRCIASGNTGATVDGFYQSGAYGGTYINCVSYGNGRDGIRLNDATSADAVMVRNCIFYGNGGYGLNSQTTAWTAGTGAIDSNAYGSNTSGAVHNLPAGAHDITLTGNPFTNASGGDFSLNSTAGAGAACRAAGFPGVFPGGTTTGYPDVGAAQHQDAGGGGTTNYYVINQIINRYIQGDEGD